MLHSEVSIPTFPSLAFNYTLSSKVPQWFTKLWALIWLLLSNVPKYPIFLQNIISHMYHMVKSITAPPFVVLISVLVSVTIESNLIKKVYFISQSITEVN